MGLFSNIIKRITGKDEDSRSKKILDRIFFLQKFKSEQEKKLSELKSEESDTSWYHIFPKESRSKSSNVFTPKKIGPVKTMKDLLEKRKREEEERIRNLKNSVIRTFDTISQFISSEDAKKAEDLLYQAASILKQVKDSSLDANFESLKEEISSLKYKLHQREIERIEREAREREEKEAIEREKIRLERERAEKERLEKERKAREYEERLAREEQERALEISRLTALVTAKKDNAQAFFNHLNLHGQRYFYHFTDEANLRSIRKFGGLYSWKYCERNNIAIPNAGGDYQSRGLDSRLGLQDYVRLSFCDDHPMAYRKQQEGANLVLLKIKIEVATFKDTIFSNINAATQDKSQNKFGPNLEDLQRVNFSATQRHYVSRNDGEIFHEHQAECMVKTFIPIEYIVNINNPSRM